MKVMQLAVGLLAYLLTDMALAGTVLGTPLGATLGVQLGSALPLVGLLSVAAVSLLVGIRIVRRKR